MKKNKAKRFFSLVNVIVVFTMVFSIQNIPSIQAVKMAPEELGMVDSIGIPIFEKGIEERDSTEEEKIVVDSVENDAVQTDLQSEQAEEMKTESVVENEAHAKANNEGNLVGNSEIDNMSKEDSTSDYTFEFIGTDGNSTAIVTGYLGTAKDISIPSTATNHEAGWTSASPVTSIKDASSITTGAFYKKGLTSVTLPNSVTSIVGSYVKFSDKKMRTTF